MRLSPDLPGPDPAALALSDQLSEQICARMDAAGGSIPFSQYMELCLYAPGLGYYSAGLRKFGEAGDFITAPEISPLFGRCLARTCAMVLEETGGGDILEFGAGSGQLAVDLLSELERLGCLPARYFILERSAELRARQQAGLQASLPHLNDRVIWLDALPEAGLRGILLANEVLDAMPVERFHWCGDAVEIFHVGRRGDDFEWQLRPADESGAGTAVQQLASQCGLPADYISELNTSLAAWVKSIAGVLEQGLLLLIDYGYPRCEYYHPQRRDGTLMCHYRHRAHDNPLILPGLQDITAYVDFTAVAEAAAAARLELAGYTTQAWFLLDCGLDALLAEVEVTDALPYLKLAQQAKKLVLPGEMGERFKCIGLGREVGQPVPGFRGQDYRHRL